MFCSYYYDYYFYYLYSKTRHFYKYMLPIVGQTAGPIGLNFFLKTLRGGRGVLQAKRNSKNFVLNFFPRATPGPLASHYYLYGYGRSA